MNNQLVPRPEFAPSSVKHLPLAKRIELWPDLVDSCEALSIAGLRAKIGPEGDLNQAYREWYARRMLKHDRMLKQFAINLSTRESSHGQ